MRALTPLPLSQLRVLPQPWALPLLLPLVLLPFSVSLRGNSCLSLLLSILLSIDEKLNEREPSITVRCVYAESES